MKTARQLRRAEERRLRKQNRKTPTAAVVAPFSPISAAPSGATPARTTEAATPTLTVAPKPISDAKRAANQANAQLSTGPRTAAGKAASSRNRLRHGLNGAFCVLAYENAAEFQSLLASLMAEHDPQTATEELLVRGLAQHHWLTQRALSFQDALLARASLDERMLALYLRYQTTHQRAFHQCLNDLTRLQKQRDAEPRGFLSQTEAEAGYTPPPPAETPLPKHPCDMTDDELEAALAAQMAQLDHFERHPSAV